MKGKKLYHIVPMAAFMILGGLVQANADILVQCPGDTTGDAVIDTPDPLHPDAVCEHLSAGDGFVNMADGYPQYIFGFSSLTGTLENDAMTEGMLGAELVSPTMVVKEGQELYLTVSNVGMVMRPDLFDPHTVHWHGFPNASAVFDGVPDASVSMNMGQSFTYYYQATEPGTYVYHCHVEATEHMQMGMYGSIWIEPGQNEFPNGTDLSGFTHSTGNKYAYNDGDGSTYYDVEYPIQLSALDSVFHDASVSTQPLRFAEMEDDYFLINGRGYPDTINEAELANTFDGNLSQKVHSHITATAGEKVLLRVSSLGIIESYTITVLGIPMQVVAKGARLLRSTTGENLYYTTNTLSIAGGEVYDVILDTTGIASGTYFLYSTNLNMLSNSSEDSGGMMTEIDIL